MKKERVWGVYKHRPAQSVDRENASVAIEGNERPQLAEDDETAAAHRVRRTHKKKHDERRQDYAGPSKFAAR